MIGILSKLRGLFSECLVHREGSYLSLKSMNKGMDFFFQSVVKGLFFSSHFYEFSIDKGNILSLHLP